MASMDESIGACSYELRESGSGCRVTEGSERPGGLRAHGRVGVGEESGGERTPSAADRAGRTVASVRRSSTTSLFAARVRPGSASASWRGRALRGWRPGRRPPKGQLVLETLDGLGVGTRESTPPSAVSTAALSVSSLAASLANRASRAFAPPARESASAACRRSVESASPRSGTSTSSRTVASAPSTLVCWTARCRGPRERRSRRGEAWGPLPTRGSRAVPQRARPPYVQGASQSARARLWRGADRGAPRRAARPRVRRAFQDRAGARRHRAPRSAPGGSGRARTRAPRRSRPGRSSCRERASRQPTEERRAASPRPRVSTIAWDCTGSRSSEASSPSTHAALVAVVALTVGARSTA